ncbi:uncharacterized protein LOC144102610 [Amblyomma americanum]
MCAEGNDDTEIGDGEEDGSSAQNRLPQQSVRRNPIRSPGDHSVQPPETPTGSQGSIPTFTQPTVSATGRPPGTSGVHTTIEPSTSTATSTSSRWTVRNSFMCTVSAQYLAFTPMPLDGLCGVLFYDSLYKENASKLPVENHSKARYFLGLATRMTQTQIGMSFAMENSDLENEYKTTTFDTGLDELWRSKISHVGILNAYLSYSLPGNINVALYILKKMDIYLKLKDRARDVFTWLGVAPNYPSYFRFYGDLMLHTFMPDVFVAIGHISYPDNEMRNCRIMPPTISKLPPGFQLPYAHTLNDSIDLVKHIAQASSFPYLVLSFDLAARLYYYVNHTAMTTSGTGGAGPFMPCIQSQYEQRRSPAEMCPGFGDRDWDNYRYYSDLLVSLTYNQRERQTMTFDSKRALQAKAYESKHSSVTIKYGLAAYSIDYDSSPRVCPELTIAGSYERVKLLRDVHDFFIAR